MDDAKKDLYGLIGILIGLAILWYFTGGPQRPSSYSGLFLDNPQQQYTNQVSEQTQQVISGTDNSPFKGIVTIGYTSGRYETDPQKEYIELTASYNNKSPVRITGWTLVGKKGLDISIGQGSILAYSSQVNPQTDIYLNPGDRAYVITGQSQIGTSFKINKCTGYFTQFQTFYPYLSTDCPRPEDEDSAANLDDQCLNYLDTLPSCRLQISIPPALSSQCQTYINNNVNYSKCVDFHKNDSDFYKSEWRIYLNRTEKLWKSERETIILKDENGKTIDSVSY